MGFTATIKRGLRPNRPHADPLTMQYPTAVQTALSANAIFALFDPSEGFMASYEHGVVPAMGALGRD